MWILEILAQNLSVVFVTELTLGFLFGARNAKKFITVMLINIITNPAVVLTALSLTLFWRRAEDTGIFILEVIVVFLEGFMFKRFKVFDNKNPYLISLVLNCVSFITGKLL